MSTPKANNGASASEAGSAAALAAALAAKQQWKLPSAVLELVKASTALSAFEKAKLQELITGSDDVVLAITEASNSAEELISDLTTFVHSAMDTTTGTGAAPMDTSTSTSASSSSSSSASAAATTSASAAAMSTTTTSTTAPPHMPAPVAVPAVLLNRTPAASPTPTSPVPTGVLNISVSSPTASSNTPISAAANSTSTATSASSASAKLPSASPPLHPATPDLSSVSPAPSPHSAAMGTGGASALPSLSLTDAKPVPQQLKELEATYEQSFKLLSAFAAKDKGKERDTVKTALKSISKMLENLKKHPSNLQYRKLRVDNIVVKKYVTSIDGAQPLMEAIGFRKLEVGAGAKKVLYLSIDERDVHAELIDRATDLIAKQIEAIDKPQPTASAAGASPSASSAASSGPKPICAGGCGFFGDPATANMCSLCYKKKHPTAAAPNEKTNSASAAASASASASASGSGSGTGKPTGLCVKGCGFFGNEQWKGMCSSCFNANKATVKKTWRKRVHIAMLKLRAMRQFTVLSKKPIQKHTNRCWKCQKKIGITGIECRCGYIFCAAHRYANEHDCDFDHKELQRKKLAKENKEVKGKKLEKIGDDATDS